MNRNTLWTLLLFLMASLTFGQALNSMDMDCQTCHEGSDWTRNAGDRFNHEETAFSLTGAHRMAPCQACHSGNSLEARHDFARADGNCESCHLDVHNNAWGTQCEQCHSTESWSLEASDFNHDLTRFPLLGAHEVLNCSQCHVSAPSSSTFLGLACQSCHTSDFQETVKPNHITLALSTNCTDCHSESSTRWSTSSFDHNTTGFPLTGQHQEVSCNACHTGPAQGTETTCYACHAVDYNTASDPEHRVAGFPTSCEDCHTSSSWSAEFEHEETGFPLNGAHESAECSSCHVNQIFAGTPSVCIQCHEDARDASMSFSHLDAQFSDDCTECHTESAWSPSTWTHDMETAFPLIGEHIEVACLGCHTVVPYEEQSSDCFACHEADYRATTDPDHELKGMPTNCAICHTPEDWSSEGINHDATGFPLEGAHAEATCNSCHDAGYDLPLTCNGCHLTDYASTANGDGPNHLLYEFSQDCLLCHTQVVWRPSVFDHNASITDFELRGAHAELLPSDCQSCHSDAQWSGIPQTCDGCHQSNFNATTDPDHDQEGYPISVCADCHSETAWRPSIFAHTDLQTECATCHTRQYNSTEDPDHAFEGYPPSLCGDCHSTTTWEPSIFAHANLEIGCESCHMQQYNNTEDPDHQQQGYPASGCADCHSTTSWEPSIFSHDNLTSTCFSCHASDYAATTNPPHETMGFETTCEACHGTSSWSPSNFDHDEPTTGFALQGAHLGVNCANCHSAWVPASSVRTCASSDCHLSDYQATTDPNHAAASFPLECAECHSQSAWEPATFDHDNQYFPIYSGRHNGEWDDCSQCHIDNSDYGLFTCFGAGCHSITSMNNEHCEGGGNCEDCNGFTYPASGVTPEDCLFCHPNGDEDDCENDLRDLPFRPRFAPKTQDPIPSE